MNVLQMPQPHKFIVGTTGTGKTVKFIHDFEECRDAGIHINFTRIPSPFPQVNGDYSIEDILKALREGEKLNYIPALDRKRAQKEVAYIVHKLFEMGGFSESKRVIFALDECHLLAPEGGRNFTIEQIATTGRTFGISGVFITQSPSMTEKILIKQADVHVIFSLSDYERDYFRTKGMDFEKIQGAVRDRAGGISHKYIVYVNGQITGPFEDKL